MTNPNKAISPKLWILASISLGTGFLNIHSIKTNKTLAPSNAGIGNKLNTAKFTAISGNNNIKFLKLKIVLIMLNKYLLLKVFKFLVFILSNSLYIYEWFFIIF